MKLWKITSCYSFLLSSSKGLEKKDSFYVFYPPPRDILFVSKECFVAQRQNCFLSPNFKTVFQKKKPKKKKLEEEHNEDIRKGKSSLPSSR